MESSTVVAVGIVLLGTEILLWIFFRPAGPRGLPATVRSSPDVLIGTLIEQHYGRRIAEIQQDITATTIPPHLALPLTAKSGTAALRIIRRYFDHTGQVFEMSVTVHSADRFTFSSRLRRERE
jgi:hypothetical protein